MAADRRTSPRRSRASASGAARPGSAASSATRSTSAIWPRPTTRSTRSRSTRCAATVDAATAIGADAVIFHVGSHLGAGLETRPRPRSGRSRQILERCDGDTWLLIENSAGTGDTIGRSVDELVDARRPSRRPSAARRLPRLVPPVRIGLRRRRPGGSSTGSSTHLDADDRPRSNPRAARERQRHTARLEPRPAREHPRGRDRRAPGRVPRAPCLPGPGRLSRGAGRRSPRAARRELVKVRELHARGPAESDSSQTGVRLVSDTFGCDNSSTGGVRRVR